jgi:hypothetical protein
MAAGNFTIPSGQFDKANQMYYRDSSASSGDFSFSELSRLSGGRSGVEVICPLCAPHRKPAHRKLKTLKIWIRDNGFATYSCAHCGAHGYAHDPSTRNSGGRDWRSLDFYRPLTTPTPKPTTETTQEPNKGDLARMLWRRSRPATGTIVETYLRTRCCYVDTATVRFLPARGDHPPALIVPFGIPSEPEPRVLGIANYNVIGVQLTKLRPDGSGKADVEPKKITLGKCLGSPIVLTPPNDLLALVIAEGVEDALTAHIASGRGAWAAGGASRLPHLADSVPDYIESITILVDHNDAGHRGSEELAARLYKRGFREVFLTQLEEVAP